MSRVRSSGRWWMTYWRRSSMVAPGSTPTPEVTTRVGIPSVWLSTAPMTRRERMGGSGVRAGQVGSGGRPDLLRVFGRELQAGEAYRPAVPADLFLGDLDGLHETGVGVPAQQRQQRHVALDRVLPLPGGAQLVQLYALARQGVGKASDPTYRPHEHGLDEGVVAATDDLEPGGGLTDSGDPPHVLGELLDRHHFFDLGQAGQHRGGEVGPGREGVVVGHDGQAGLGHLAEVGDYLLGGRGMGSRRQAHDRGATTTGGLLGPAPGLGPGLG